MCKTRQTSCLILYISGLGGKFPSASDVEFDWSLKRVRFSFKHSQQELDFIEYLVEETFNLDLEKIILINGLLFPRKRSVLILQKHHGFFLSSTYTQESPNIQQKHM